MRLATKREIHVAKAILFGPHNKSTAIMTDEQKKLYFEGAAGENRNRLCEGRYQSNAFA